MRRSARSAASRRVVRVLWTGDFMSKLAALVVVAIGVLVLGSVAGPATTALAQLLLVLAGLFAVYSLVLRR